MARARATDLRRNVLRMTSGSEGGDATPRDGGSSPSRSSCSRCAAPTARGAAAARAPPYPSFPMR